MFIVSDREGYVHLFHSMEDICVNLEVIDIEEDEYLFFDEDAQIFIAEITSPPGFFSTGSFQLLPTGMYDKEKLFSIIEQAKDIWPLTGNIKSREDLKGYISKSMSERDKG